MATLPRPLVNVSTTVMGDGAHATVVTVHRDGKQRTWSGTGESPSTATGDAVKKMLDDPHTAEYVKETH